MNRITIISGPDSEGLWSYRVGSPSKGENFRGRPTLAVRNSPEWSDAFAEYKALLARWEAEGMS